MTIVTVLVSPEGIVLGADTQTTISIRKKNESGKILLNPVNFFRNAQKIFDISINKNILALSQFGNAFPGGKPLSNHVFSIRELLAKGNDSDLSTIESVSDKIIEYFSQFEDQQKQGLGFYVSGFDKENGKVVPCIRFIQFRKDTKGIFQIQNIQKVKVEGSKDYGLSWNGEGSWIISKLLKLSDKTQNIPQSSIPFHILSLQDGVELTEYLINTVIGFERFQTRFPTCGGKSIIAVLTPRNFTFIGNNEPNLLI